MKVLLYITTHRQIEEFELYAYFAKNHCKELTEIADVFVHCNSMQDTPKIMEAFSKLPHKNKNIVFVTENCGYKIGVIQQLCWGYEHNIFKDYDFVIHHHIDVFIMHDKTIMKILNETLSMPQSMIVTRSWPDRVWFDTDFLIFKPNKLPFNIFLLYKSFPGVGEELLVKQVQDYKLPTIIVGRFSNNCCFPRRIADQIELWHEHDLAKVRDYIQKLESA